MELDSLKKDRNESYLDFCHRVQHLRSILFSKINETVNNPEIRQAKQAIYNNTSLNVFLFNLPAYLVRLVRLRNVTTLEDALKTVLEEQNFQTVYDSKNPRSNQNFRPNFNNYNSFQNRNPRPRQSNNFNSPIHNAQMNSNASNYQHNSINSNNNSLQFRSNRALNNQNNYNAVSRSPVRQSSTQQRQHFTNNALSPMPSTSNTDITMRTASSRRVNYTDTDNTQPSCSYNCESNPISANHEQIGNFFILASTMPKK